MTFQTERRMLLTLCRLLWQRRHRLTCQLWGLTYWALIFAVDRTVKEFLTEQERHEMYALLDQKRFDDAETLIRTQVESLLGRHDIVTLDYQREIRLKRFVHEKVTKKQE
jgi:hypothetical protein